VNWFDTAEVYGIGASERSLSAALDTLDNAREEALGGRAVDLHRVHQPFSFSSVAKQMDGSPSSRPPVGSGRWV
jgi:hypothetical protein